jgi:hypothetical protein
MPLSITARLAAEYNADTMRAHNQRLDRVVSDGQPDTCQCATCRCIGCRPDSFAPGDAQGAQGLALAATPLLAGDDLAPALLRGPVQDESGATDPLDARAMREVEGRKADDHQEVRA